MINAITNAIVPTSNLITNLLSRTAGLVKIIMV